MMQFAIYIMAYLGLYFGYQFFFRFYYLRKCRRHVPELALSNDSSASSSLMRAAVKAGPAERVIAQRALLRMLLIPELSEKIRLSRDDLISIYLLLFGRSNIMNGLSSEEQTEFIEAIMRHVSLHGRKADRPILTYMTKAPKIDPVLRTSAVQKLKQMDARLQGYDGPSTLVQPSSDPDKTGALLRPAQNATDTDLNLLVRPVQEEEHVVIRNDDKDKSV